MAMDFMPDIVETRLQTPSYFFFCLPATAFGIADESMIMEISVDYGLSPDGKSYQANVWARQKGAKVKHFIYPISVPVSSEPTLSIMDALNGDEKFFYLMVDYICEAAIHRVD